jgi:hypothetical protein
MVVAVLLMRAVVGFGPEWLGAHQAGSEQHPAGLLLQQEVP